ncbi:hypothetical protein GIB67_018606 [Kingdonia uniflora]|uniref:Disease resistance N-terminal domain-containing protein n=1 Tax=Kingdonia uniflora TaxID=39325 RepID=A0A7J7L8A0_9MAGN|nr:hypothetical protein GIB67_018606 [Kingdonia uniflora]
MAEATTIRSALTMITSEVTFLWGVRDEVEWIKAELTRMQDFLKDADEKRKRNLNVRTWLMDITDVAYDAEDLMEAITLKDLKKSQKGLIKRYFCIFNNLIYLHKVVTNITQIKVRIKSVTERKVSYNIENILDQESSFTSVNLWKQRRSSVHIGEMAIVGLEEDLKKLKGILIGEDPELRVISIMGMGGIAFNIEEIMGEIEKQVNISSGRKAKMAMEGSVNERAFTKDGCPPYLEEFARNILKKCEELPLVIVVLGGLLSTKDLIVNAWSRVLDSLNWHLDQDGTCRAILAELLRHTLLLEILFSLSWALP